MLPFVDFIARDRRARACRVERRRTRAELRAWCWLEQQVAAELREPRAWCWEWRSW